MLLRHWFFAQRSFLPLPFIVFFRNPREDVSPAGSVDTSSLAMIQRRNDRGRKMAIWEGERRRSWHTFVHWRL